VARWKFELDRIGSMFQEALLDLTPLSLFNVLFAFLCAPGSVLGVCFEEKERHTELDTSDSTVKAALRRMMKGQEGRALKVLCSNGVAKVDAATIAACKKLHPQRTGELKLPSVVCEQLRVEEKDMHDKLFRDAGDSSLSKDVFGWAAWLFFPWRGEEGGFFKGLARFACLIANEPETMPSLSAVLLGAGALTPLHKLSKQEQAQREAGGLEPKLRPINSGCMLAKAVLSMVLATPQAQQAAARAKPQQLSLGTPRGIEKLIHACRAAHASKYIVGRNDFENGFNSLSRQKMLEANAALFPEATSVMNFFYGTDAPVFLLDPELNATVIWSSEGPRQGCAAGTFLFCNGIVSVLSKLQVLYPEFSLLALTDDINALLPPPAHDTPHDWQGLYKRYASFLRDLRDISRDHAGLSLNAGKCGMLLPEGAPLPDEETRALFPAGFDFQQQGFRVAGSPVVS
jgi:hypothetical protein